MQGIKDLIAIIEKQSAQIEQIIQENNYLKKENTLLREKVNYLIKQKFGRKSENVDLNQLLLTGLGENCNNSHMPGVNSDHENIQSTKPSRKRRKKKDNFPRLPDNLLTEEIVIIPEEVKRNLDGYRYIGEERTEELDVIQQQYFKRIYVRRKYVSKESNYIPPIIEPMPPRLIEGSIASPGLLSEIIIKKYMDHLPLHRQERILKERFDITLSRKTMSDWIDKGAHWLKSIYESMKEELKEVGYLQIDETPIKYLTPYGSKQGYFWLYKDPSGNIIIEWKISRSHECLNDMLKNYMGMIHCDGYSAYKCFSKKHPLIIFLFCFAHARRYFFDAKETHPKIVGWFLQQIRLLYQIEKELRNQRAGPALREAIRQSESQMILKRIYKAIKLKLPQYRPKEKMGKALHYALNHWEGLSKYIYHGKAEIDNNLVENAVRPTALGKKNWLFIGDANAGQKSAILYSIIESCRSYGINPHAYLSDVFSRLPKMKNSDVKNLTPKNWARIKTSNVA